MPFIESRYAKALLCVAPTDEIAEQTGGILSDFSSIMLSHGELRDFLLNPVISKEIKKDTLKQIFSGGETPFLLNFLFLLTDKERLGLLPDISREYTRLRNIMRDNLQIEVYSSVPLDESQIAEIRGKYQKRYGAASAEVHCFIDTSLLGGVRVKIGDTYMDDTLLSRLKGLLTTFSRSAN